MLCSVLKHLSNILIITTIIGDRENDLGWKMELLPVPSCEHPDNCHNSTGKSQRTVFVLCESYKPQN